MKDAAGYTSSSHSANVGTENTSGWSLYVFYPISLVTLYEEMINKAATFEERDLGIYFQLALEGHFLLLGKLASLQSAFINPAKTNFFPERRELPPGSPGVDFVLPLMGPDIDHARFITIQLEAQNYHKLLKKSSTLLADYYLRNKRYTRAALFFAESDRQLSYVMQVLMPLVGNSKSGDARKAVTIYFDKVGSSSSSFLLRLPRYSSSFFSALRFFSIAECWIKWMRPQLLQMTYWCTTKNMHQLNSPLSFLMVVLAVTIKSWLLTSWNASRQVHIYPINLSITLPVVLHLSLLTLPFLGSSGGGSQHSLDDIPSYYLLAPKNVFVKAILYLDLNRVIRAVTDMLSLEAEILVEFCVANSKLLFSDTDSKHLLSHFPFPSSFPFYLFLTPTF
jgi:hypothetical protein